MTASHRSTAALRPRGTPYEYWFLKLNAGELAFLVDFIIRRPAGAAEIRLSYWIRGSGTVTHDTHATWDLDDGVRIGGGEFAEGRTAGFSSGVRWDISWAAGPRWLEPARLGGMLRAFETQIALSPGARASGSVDIGGERFTFASCPAVISHYWSRRLPDRWVWISANTVDGDVEALFATQRLFGIPFLRVGAGYAFVAGRGPARFVISPLTGLGGASGTRDDVRVHAWGPRSGRIDIEARTGLAASNDLGEGIRQTLLADGHALGREVRGVMGLETRGWS